MSATTKIQWTDRTWNPVRGCSVISPGCVNCYAMKQAHRFSGEGRPFEGLTKMTKAGPQWTGAVRTVEAALLEPLSWRTPQRVFVNSMSDLFHEGVSDAFIDRVFAVMALSQRHSFQVLTKRADRMLAYMTSAGLAQRIAVEMCMTPGWDRVPAIDDFANVTWRFEESKRPIPAGLSMWPLPNVWVGVSVEDQKHADERIPLLLQTPAAVRFISAEPLLGPLDLEAVPLPTPGASYYGLTGVAQPLTEKDAEPDDWKYWTRHGAKLDWVIVGGESGPGARPFDLAWARSIVQQCKAAGVACFVKQLGAHPFREGAIRQNAAHQGPGTHREQQSIEFADRKGGDPSEWPADLRVRNFPTAAR